MADLDPEHGDADFSSDHAIPPKMIKYRNLTGINTPKTLLDAGLSRPGRNIGIYSRVISEEYSISWQYWIMSGVIEGTFLSQIAIGAALTALGAANSSHIAITVLGSMNTVIAGIQTYLKGQGLPNRLQQYQNGLRKLREHIEDLERHFSHEDCKLNVDHEIAEVAAMYHAVRQTAEDNTPDTYLPMAGAGAKLLGKARASAGGTPSTPSKPGAPAPAAASGAAAAPQPPPPETAPEALAPDGKPPTADEVAEAGGAEASKPAPPPADTTDKKDDAGKDKPTDATTDEKGKNAENTDKPTEGEASKGQASGETQAPEHDADHEATEETPLLKK